MNYFPKCLLSHGYLNGDWKKRGRPNIIHWPESGRARCVEPFLILSGAGEGVIVEIFQKGYKSEKSAQRVMVGMNKPNS